MSEAALDMAYAEQAPVCRLVDVLRYTVEGISRSFDRYGEDLVKGPGLYVAVVCDRNLSAYADPMSANAWPVDTCAEALADLEAFYAAARSTAVTEDGAVVIGVDGIVREQMVRFRDLESDVPGEQTIEYADWMGSRHMSAIDTSFRPQVVVTVTLSEETGRVSTFEDGDYVSNRRSELGGRWRTEN